MTIKTTLSKKQNIYCMKKILILVFMVTSCSFAQDVSAFFTDCDMFLNKHVSGTKVDYSTIKKDTKELDNLINTINKIDVSKADDKNLKAFYINAYNIIMINAIVSKYPVKSPMDIAGIFDTAKYPIAGSKLTLNEIENKMIRAKYNDARIHFVLVCGANGCPPITNFAYTPELLDKKLNEQTKLAINNPNFIKINEKNKTVKVSQIFEWYKKDFISENSSLLDYLNQFRTNKIPSNYKITYYNYDWSLNKK